MILAVWWGVCRAMRHQCAWKLMLLIDLSCCVGKFAHYPVVLKYRYVGDLITHLLQVIRLNCCSSRRLLVHLPLPSTDIRRRWWNYVILVTEILSKLCHKPQPVTYEHTEHFPGWGSYCKFRWQFLKRKETLVFWDLIFPDVKLQVYRYLGCVAA